MMKKIYKYKSLLKSENGELEQFYQIILDNKIWCGSPVKFNDKNEFLFQVDYTPSKDTKELLAAIIQKYKADPLLPPMISSSYIIDSCQLEKIASPIILEDISMKCRKEIGVTCFSELRDDPLLWERYGGFGNGVCIEIEINNELIGKEYHYVNYVSNKIFHIDDIFKSAIEDPFINYRNVLLTKTLDWGPETELRLVSKIQSVTRDLNGTIKEIIIGREVKSEIKKEIIKRIGEFCYQNKIQLI